MSNLYECVFEPYSKKYKKLSTIGLVAFCMAFQTSLFADIQISSDPSKNLTPTVTSTASTSTDTDKSSFSIDDFLKELEAEKNKSANGKADSPAPSSLPAALTTPQPIQTVSVNPKPQTMVTTQPVSMPSSAVVAPPVVPQNVAMPHLKEVSPAAAPVKETVRTPVMDASLSTVPSLNSGQVSEEDSQESYYTSPGIIAFKDGKWIGSDHLYNLPHDIFLNVEILKPENAEITLSENHIRERVTNAFKHANINVVDKADSTQGPLPLYHVLIMIYPIDRGFVAYCDGRLFESVKLQRVVLDKTTQLQAITWENQSLILAPEKEFSEQLNKTIDEISAQFVNRFQYYENIKMKNKK